MTETKGQSTHLRIVSDAAYKRETDDGYSLRGALFCRGGGQTTETFGKDNAAVHVIDWACKSQRHVTRSTFSAEPLGAGDATDQGILIAHMLTELEEGVLTAEEARRRRMSGGYLPIALYVDAKSVYAAVTATFIKQPAEKSLLCHVQYLCGLLDKDMLHSIVWLDTSDMGADGLTKGAVSREALHELMSGSMKFRHPLEEWRRKVIQAQVGVASDKFEAAILAQPEAQKTHFGFHRRFHFWL